MGLVSRSLPLEADEEEALRSLLAKELDEVRAEDRSWAAARAAGPGAGSGYLEVWLRAGDVELCFFPGQFQTPAPFPRCWLWRPVAALRGSPRHRAWIEELRARATAPSGGRERERIERHLSSEGAPLARDLGPVSEISALDTLFWPRRRTDRDRLELRFLHPGDEQTLARAGAEAAELEGDVAITQFQLGFALATGGGRRLAVWVQRDELAVAFDRGAGDVETLVEARPL